MSKVITVPEDLKSVGQYEYKDFEEVLKWVEWAGEVDSSCRNDLIYFLRIRAEYMDECKFDHIKSSENMIKNLVGIKRCVNDIAGFSHLYYGKGLRFHQGKFIDFQSDVTEYDFTLRGVVVYPFGNGL